MMAKELSPAFKGLFNNNKILEDLENSNYQCLFLWKVVWLRIKILLLAFHSIDLMFLFDYMDTCSRCTVLFLLNEF